MTARNKLLRIASDPTLAIHPLVVSRSSFSVLQVVSTPHFQLVSGQSPWSIPEYCISTSVAVIIVQTAYPDCYSPPYVSLAPTCQDSILQSPITQIWPAICYAQQLLNASLLHSHCAHKILTPGVWTVVQGISTGMCAWWGAALTQTVDGGTAALRLSLRVPGLPSQTAGVESGSLSPKLKLPAVPLATEPGLSFLPAGSHPSHHHLSPLWRILTLRALGLKQHCQTAIYSGKSHRSIHTGLITKMLFHLRFSGRLQWQSSVQIQ